MVVRNLRCPQCGAVRLFFTASDGNRCYFTMDTAYLPSTRGDTAALKEITAETVFGCCGCSWTGRSKKLVTTFDA